MTLNSCHKRIIARLNSWVCLPKMNSCVCLVTDIGACTALHNKKNFIPKCNDQYTSINANHRDSA